MGITLRIISIRTFEESLLIVLEGLRYSSEASGFWAFILTVPEALQRFQGIFEYNEALKPFVMLAIKLF